MISPIQPSKVFILLVISCLAWIGIISLGVVFFVGAAAVTGWMIAGILLLLVASGFAVIAAAIRNAVEMPDNDPLVPGFQAGGMRASHLSPSVRGPIQPRRTLGSRRLDRPTRRAAR